MTQRKLILNWQSEATREIVPVAELIVVANNGEERFEFGYLQGVHYACSQGFNALLAFPDLEQRYASGQLFPFFRNRILPTTRPDYLDYIAALNLDPDTADHVELLGRGNARRQTDRIEMVLAPERDTATGRYLTRFLVRGVRHVAGAEEAVRSLQSGDALTLVPEPDNASDPRARLLVFRGAAIGYLPTYLLSDLEALTSGHEGHSCVIERVNLPPHPAHHRVLARLEAEWPDGFEPLDAPEFRLYRPDSEAGTLAPTG